MITITFLYAKLESFYELVEGHYEREIYSIIFMNEENIVLKKAMNVLVKVDFDTEDPYLTYVDADSNSLYQMAANIYLEYCIFLKVNLLKNGIVLME